MRENSTVPGCVVISGFRGRQGANFIGFLMLFLLLPWFMPMQPALADTAQGFPEIAVDNAVITSPQTTFASLLRLTNAYQELVAESGITRENQDRVTNIYQQMEKLFDLSMVPPKYRRHVAAESAVYLREALARYPIPPMEDVPDEDQMVALIDEGRAPLYRLPGTPVVIRKLGEGVYEGRYQFTSATVAEAKNWYGVARA